MGGGGGSGGENGSNPSHERPEGGRWYHLQVKGSYAEPNALRAWMGDVYVYFRLGHVNHTVYVDSTPLLYSYLTNSVCMHIGQSCLLIRDKIRLINQRWYEQGLADCTLNQPS